MEKIEKSHFKQPELPFQFCDLRVNEMHLNEGDISVTHILQHRVMQMRLREGRPCINPPKSGVYSRLPDCSGLNCKRFAACCNFYSLSAAIN